MNVFIKNITEAACACDVLILPVTEDNPGYYGKLGPALKRLFRKALAKEFSGKHLEMLLLHCPAELKADRILLAGLGSEKELSAERVRQAGGKALAYLRDQKMQKVGLSTESLSDRSQSPADFVEGALLGLYEFNRYRTEQRGKKVAQMTVLARPSRDLSSRVNEAKTTASAVWFARDLINTPANDMTPSDLAKTAFSLRQKNLAVKVLEKKDAEKLGMQAFLSVTRGSKQPPKCILLEYRGGRKGKAPLALVGKSITFDSGGLSLKPADGMEKMKYDMAGGAAVLGVFHAAAKLKLPVNLVGVLPAAENLPGGTASKPGDVVRALNGRTVEIINTDAEGRLVLIDAIGYAKKYKPSAIIDIATLTGACSIALGNEAIAMMGNDRGLIEGLKKASEETFERVWEMPLFEEYREYLKSDIADIKNAGGRNGSLVTSAAFLSYFAGDIPWVHLDIAGTAWVEKEKPYIPKGASGVGVRLILNLIKRFK